MRYRNHHAHWMARTDDLGEMARRSRPGFLHRIAVGCVLLRLRIDRGLPRRNPPKRRAA